jgi:hypothetical protein
MSERSSWQLSRCLTPRVRILRLASLVGLAVVVCSGWFAAMELALRHPGYGWRVLVAAALVAEGALTIAVCEDLFERAPFRWPLIGTATATGLLGGWIIAEDLARPGLPARPHFEGYLLIIGLALIAYALLTIATLAMAAPAPSRPASASRS